jgi:hypothetical protein
MDVISKETFSEDEIRNQVFQEIRKKGSTIKISIRILLELLTLFIGLTLLCIVVWRIPTMFLVSNFSKNLLHIELIYR